MTNPGAILEPACLYADQGAQELTQLAQIVERYHCRNAVIHAGDVNFLKNKIDASRIAVVVDFPFGRGGNHVISETILNATDVGIRNFDVCVNLIDVLSDDMKKVKTRFAIVEAALNHAWVLGREVKAIIQLPYLWQYARSRIDPLICVLADCGVKVIKDWTTVSNFSKPVDWSLNLKSRLDALDYVRRVIDLKGLHLKIKIAGGVRPVNAVEFVQHGADILGVGIQYAPDVIRVLASSEDT